MKLYFANCTDQDQVVNIRQPKPGLSPEGFPQFRKNFFTQTIQVGRQVIIAAQELGKSDIDAIIEQQGVYGVRSCKDFEHARERGLIVPMVYNIDEPVPHEMHMRIVKWNRAQLQDRGKKLREDAAIATSVSMRERSPQAADNVWMSVQEEKPGTMEYDGDAINDGVRMERLDAV
jgi:hypothetical protein